MPPPEGMHWARRWWRYRRIHRLFGLKFWAIVVGAAPLDPELEAFWGELGFVVVQGYGLTETAPIVTLNHPLRHASGARSAKPIAGVEVKIADDGEILVRGENVTTRLLQRAGGDARGVRGRLVPHRRHRRARRRRASCYIRGRKKEMIVTPEGLNVFPEDVERVAERAARRARLGRRRRAGRRQQRRARARRARARRRAPTSTTVVRAANAALARSPEDPRGVGLAGSRAAAHRGHAQAETRASPRSGLASGSRPRRGAEPADATSPSIARREFAPGRDDLAPTTTIDELGLSSLERVELMMALEDAFQVTHRRRRRSPRATSVADLEALVGRSRAPAAAPRGQPRRAGRLPDVEPSLPVRAVRRASLPTWILPLARVFAWITVEGLEHLRAARRAGHLRRQPPEPHGHAGDPRLRCRRGWRYRVAPAMAKEFFKAHFFPEQYGRARVVHQQPELLPRGALLQRVPAAAARGRRAADAALHRRAARRRLLGADLSGGQADRAGEIGRFQPGIGMIASRLDVPVVPVRLDGLDHVLHHTREFPDARPRPRRLRRAAVADRATTTQRWPRRSKRPSERCN